jgi:hypothetical protein
MMLMKNTILANGTCLSLLLSLIATLSASTQAQTAATDVRASIPRPGLYQVDITSTTTNFAGGMAIESHQNTNGKTGDVVAYQVANGQRTPDRLFKGERANTECVAALSLESAAKASSVLAATAIAGVALANCPDQTTIYTADGYVHKANCPTSKMTLTVKKIDSDNWEFDQETTMFQSSAGPDMSGMRMMAESMAKNGTPEEKAKAQKALAELPTMQRQQAQGQSAMLEELKKAEAKAKTPEEAAMLREMRAKMAGNSPTMKSVMLTHKTRIGDSCEVPKSKK